MFEGTDRLTTVTLYNELIIISNYDYLLFCPDLKSVTKNETFLLR